MMEQETQGLLSPLARDIRLRRVASCIAAGSVVLDLGCGAGRLAELLPPGCTYLGIDRVAPDDTRQFADFIALDLNDPDSFAAAHRWIDVRPDYLTCAAMLEHVTDPGGLIRQFSRLLTRGGSLVATTAHPRARLVHDSLARLYLCSRCAAAEHETFLGPARIRDIATSSHGRLVAYRTFLWRLNQLFVIRYEPGADVSPHVAAESGP